MIKPISFCAKTAINYKTEKKKATSQSKSQIAREYDARIAKLLQEKQTVLEIDEFLNSKEAKATLNKLPKEDIINISTPKNENETFSLTYQDSTVFNRLTLQEFEDWKGSEMDVFFPIKKDGTLDKKGIIKWINKTVEFFDSINKKYL